MSDLETTQLETNEVASSADPNSVVLEWTFSGLGENGNLSVPSDVIVSETALQFTPDTLDISQHSTGHTTGFGVRYERDIVSAPSNGGFYVKTGVDASFSHHTGRLDAQVRPFIDETRSNVLDYAGDQIGGLRDDLVAAGVDNPDQVIDALTNASDTAINFVLDNPTEIANFRASDVQIPDSVPDEAREAINTALMAIEERVQNPDVQGTLADIDEINQVYENGISRDYDAYSLSAGAFIEAGNEVRDFEFGGLHLDQLDYFVTARAGFGATLYDMGNDDFYGCYGPEASVGAGIRAHFNDKMAAVATVDHNLGLDRDCPGGVTQEVDPQTSISIGLEYELGNQGDDSVPRTGKGPVLMSF